jgi:cytochrome bd-type quinol oxidase subunit 2
MAPPPQNYARAPAWRLGTESPLVLALQTECGGGWVGQEAGDAQVHCQAAWAAGPRIAERWFLLQNIRYLWPVPLVTALTAFWAWRALAKGRDVTPFLASIGLFFLGYLGLVISSFPYLVPPSLTIWQTAAALASQMFMLVGTLVLLALIFGYTGYLY